MVPGEIIKNVELLGDGKETWLGSIHIQTSKQTWDAGTSTSGHGPYQIVTGSGLLFGTNIYTTTSDEGQGSDIADMSFLCLGQPLEHIDITSITFTNDPSGSNAGISSSKCRRTVQRSTFRDSYLKFCADICGLGCTTRKTSPQASQNQSRSRCLVNFSALELRQPMNIPVSIPSSR